MYVKNDVKVMRRPDLEESTMEGLSGRSLPTKVT